MLNLYAYVVPLSWLVYVNRGNFDLPTQSLLIEQAACKYVLEDPHTKKGTNNTLQLTFFACCFTPKTISLQLLPYAGQNRMFSYSDFA